MFNNYIGQRIDTHSQHASETSLMNESVAHLEQRVFVKEQQQNNKLIDSLRDFLKFERQAVRTEIKEFRNLTNNVAQKDTTTTNCSDFDEKTSSQELRNKIAVLQHQIESLHETYLEKLEEQNSKIVEKNEFFLHLIQQIHSKHSEEVEYYRGVIAEFEEEKRQIGNIETKMNQIGTGIEDILKQSSQLTRRNEELEYKIGQQEQMLQEARIEIEKYKQLANTFHIKSDECKKLRLRGIKFQRDLTQLINEAESRISQVTPKDPHQICNVYGVQKVACTHCKINNMQSKYDKMVTSED